MLHEGTTGLLIFQYEHSTVLRNVTVAFDVTSFNSVLMPSLRPTVLSQTVVAALISITGLVTNSRLLSLCTKQMLYPSFPHDCLGYTLAILGTLDKIRVVCDQTFGSHSATGFK